ncbi:LacI family DNA-binding transcriptional regulator [Botrimarina hoheduenensis]|uniref:HTH-type transcriptional repressor CytR n=1 Tax=Botrimarina hoheduenensis TaxID=2528000 RepID=A0A5C5WA42_9BACT|nr:LacI family DNA-binding transcriptional regulator [Botrimarina hoheduenensis]TWT47748.1 HTH-type transcriptional repressor CytR [Botrimarina hoheduenensis]
MSDNPRIGLKDIAAHTGVSSAAVSLVLNNRPGVSTATRRRVSDAAQQLGYVPRRTRQSAPRAAHAMRSIGFYAFGVNAALGHSYYGDILSGASAAAREMAVQLSFEAFDGPIEDVAELPTEACDGLLITGRPPRDFIDRLHRDRVPYVLVCCSLAHLVGDAIGPENVESSYQVVQHLANRGHRRIAYLGGEPNNADARERFLGYRWAVEDLGLDDDPDLALLSFFDTEHGASGLAELYDRAEGFSAVYAASDFLAMGVYQWARERDLSIPADLSVVGFDNNSLSQTLHPKLTTIGLDRERVGRLAVNRLSELVATPQAPMVMRLPGKLIERNSCRDLRS